MKRFLVLLLVLVLVANVRVVLGNSGYEVHPSLDTNSFIVYYETDSTGNTSVVNVFPPSFRIQYTAEYDIVVNGWWCPAWWDPKCDPTNYRYRVVSKRYSYLTLPPQVIEYNGIRILLTYFTSISVLPYASRSWWGWFEEHVKVTLSLHVYGRVDKPPLEPVRIDLGSLIAENISSDRIILQFSVIVERTEPEPEKYSIGSSFELLLDGLEISFYKLYAREISVYTYGAIGTGGYSEEGYIMITPVGEVYVELCLDGDPGYVLAGTVSYTSRYGEFEAEILLESGQCTSTYLYDVVLIPGNYSGNNKFVVTFKSGALVVNLGTDTIVPGVMVAVSQPFIVLTYEEDDGGITWSARVYAGVDYNSYMYSEPAYVYIHGRISVQNITRVFSCPETVFTDKGVYECEVYLGNLGIDPGKVSEAVADVIVSLSLYGVVVEDTVSVTCSVIAPTSTHGIAATIYEMVSVMVFALAVGLVILYLVNHLAVLVTGRPLLDPFYVGQGLLTCIALVAIVFSLPYFHWFIARLAYSIPEFKSSLRGTVLSDPDQLLGMPPSHVIAMLMNYYDMTLTSLKIDYKVWFEEQMSAHILPRLIGVSIIISILLAISVVLMISMNATTAGAIVVPLVGFVSTLIGLIIMTIPMAGIVQALIALAEFFTVVIVIVVMIIFLAGIVLSLIPLPTTTRFAEDFLGAGILYLIGVPGFAPLLYSLYKFIIQVLDHYISVIEEFTILDFLLPLLPVVKLVIPIAPVMRMMSYLAVATLISSMIILLQVFVLTRIGVMRGIGEGLLRVIRR